MSRFTFSPFVAVITFILGSASVIPVWFFDSSPIGKTLESFNKIKIVQITEPPEINAYIKAEAENDKKEAKIEEDRGVYGYFYIAGKAPKIFANIDAIDIDEKGSSPMSNGEPFYGMITLKSEKAPSYYLLKPSVENNKISFKTKAVRGVSYEFKGTFRKDFDESQDGEVVMRGVLKQIKAGKVIGTNKVAFSWFLDC